MSLTASLGLGSAVRPAAKPAAEAAPSSEARGRSRAQQRSRADTPDDFSHQELVIRFVVWAHQLHRFPSVEQIRTRFGVSRATAYRWRDALAAAHGIQTPANAPEDGDE